MRATLNLASASRTVSLIVVFEARGATLISRRSRARSPAAAPTSSSAAASRFARSFFFTSRGYVLRRSLNRPELHASRTGTGRCEDHASGRPAPGQSPIRKIHDFRLDRRSDTAPLRTRSVPRPGPRSGERELKVAPGAEPARYPDAAAVGAPSTRGSRAGRASSAWRCVRSWPCARPRLRCRRRANSSACVAAGARALRGRRCG